MKRNGLLKEMSGIFFLILCCSVIFFACSGPSKQTDETTTQDSLQSNVETKKVTYPVPTPFEITSMLNKAGASYIIGISNPLENVGKYMTESSKALNLGIYGADLSYATTYNRGEETMQYLNNVKKLTDDVGVKSMINQNIIERVEKNITILDSLHKFITSSYYETFEVLNSQGKGDVAVLILSGGWVEGVYLSTQLMDNSDNKEAINKGIVSQKQSLSEILTLLEENKDKNEKIPEILSELKNMQEIFNNVPTEGVLTGEQINKLKEMVTKMRTAIIS